MFRTAMFYGGVMGSFAVERFGTERLQSVTREEIDARFKLFMEISHLDKTRRAGWPPGLAERRAAAIWSRDAGDGCGRRRGRRLSLLRWPRWSLGFVALMVCYSRGYMLLYGDAVAHLGIARRILDSRNPGLSQLGGVWLPLPHLLMLPFVQKMEWWQNGLAGAWPSMLCYILAVIADLSAGAADDDAAMGACGDAVFWAESESALSVDDGDDGAAVSGAADLADAADDGVCGCDSCVGSLGRLRGG